MVTAETMIVRFAAFEFVLIAVTVTLPVVWPARIVICVDETE